MVTATNGVSGAYQHESLDPAILERTLNSTLCKVFLESAERRGDRVAHRWYRNGEWHEMSWPQYIDIVARVATGLRELGVGEGSRVALLLPNSPEYHILDNACLFLRAVTVSVYPNAVEEQIARQLAHANCSIVVGGTVEQLRRLDEAAVRAEHPIAARILGHPADAEETAGLDPNFVPFAELAAHEPLDLAATAELTRADDLITIVYTSGTTGPPKGVKITHALAHDACVRFYERMNRRIEDFRVISYLPFAHSAERTASLYPQMIYGFEVTSCADIRLLPETVLHIRPTMWFGPPRYWEKTRSQILARLDERTKASFEAVCRQGEGIAARELAGEEVPAVEIEAWQAARKREVVRALEPIGLDQVQVAFSGAAPMPEDLQRWWVGVGIPLGDCFGSTETFMLAYDGTSMITPGTSGPPLAGVQVRFDEDGEVLVRSAAPFVGYLDDPEATARALTEDGFYRTGDIGRLDERGNLKIVDRKKHLLVPSSGHNVSPAHLEAALKEHELIAQACVVGNGRPYCAALIVLEPELLNRWWKAAGDPAPDFESLLEGNNARAIVEAHIDEVNSRFPRAEQLGGYHIVEGEWLPGSAVMTLTQKLRPRAVEAQYADEIELMYKGPDIRRPAAAQSAI